MPASTFFMQYRLKQAITWWQFKFAISECLVNDRLSARLEKRRIPKRRYFVLIQAESVEFFFGVNNGYSISRSRKETHLTPHKTWLCGPPLPLCNGINGLYRRSKVAWSWNWKINLVYHNGSEVVLLSFQCYVHRQDWCLKAHGQHKNLDIVVGRVTMFKVGWPRNCVTNPSRVKRIFYYPRYPHRLWGAMKFVFNV